MSSADKRLGSASRSLGRLGCLLALLQAGVSARSKLGLELKELDEQHGNQCCPNLNVKGIFSGSHEDFDLEVLFQGLEEQLNLPPVLVNGRDGVSS